MSANTIARIQQDLMAGRQSSAVKKARIEAKKRPNDPNLQNIAGICLSMAGDHAAAVPYFARARQAVPENDDYAYNLILSRIMSGQLEKAETGLAALSDPRRNSARFLHLQAMLCLQDQRQKQAISLSNQVLAEAPAMLDALNVRGTALSELNHTKEALADFEAICARDPSNVLALENCGERLTELGRSEEAAKRFRSLLEILPGHAFALTRLADLEPQERLSDLLASITSAQAGKKVSAADRAQLWMARGAVLDRIGQAEQAMVCFSRAHEIDAKHRPLRRTSASREFDEIERLAGQRFSIELPVCHPRPIFVIGLPRSGTSLVEVILSAADGVEGAGELTAARRQFAKCFGAAECPVSEALAAFASGYRDDLPDFAAGTQAFVDKMPDNYRIIGLLAAAFPNASIVNVERDPRDIALSLWKQRFPAETMAYASRMSGIAEQANLYRKFLRIWGPVCGEQMLTLRYEDLVNDPERETRRLAAHCGLEWSEAMLHPDQSQAAVRTASLTQVRQKLHARSVGGWRRHETLLRDLIAGLDPELWPPDPA